MEPLLIPLRAPRGRTVRPCTQPQSLRHRHWIETQLLPPYAFVSVSVELAMVNPAKRHGEFVAYFKSHSALLRELKMMRIRRAAAAGEAGLGAHEL